MSSSGVWMGDDNRGKNGTKWARNGNGTDTGAAAAVRDAERLMQVEVADIAAEVARLRETHECIEIGAVDVHLTAGVVHRRAHFADVLLVHTVR